MISPSGNTTFDVVFLGRDEGFVENTLYIHTSAGSFRFVVRARGTPNPYRLRPLIGVRMPVNSSYSPMIELHNPHPEPIQVTPVCTLRHMKMGSPTEKSTSRCSRCIRQVVIST